MRKKFFKNTQKHFLNHVKEFLLFFLVGFALQLQGQSLQEVTSPSPMAYELGKYGASKPNLYTGTATVSVPLHTIDFDGWQLPISLSYDTSGVRANQDATEVGLGWALNATGVITRIVKTNNDLHTSSTVQGFTFPGYVYEEESPEEFFNALENYENNPPSYAGLNLKSFDGEPDDFNYNFFGYSGGFVFGKKNEDGSIPIKQKQKNGVEISFVEASSSFEITTPTGFTGLFSIKERSTNFSGNASIGGPFDSSNEDLVAIQNRGNFRVISAWYLKKITSPTGKEILFNYNIDETESSSYVSLSSPAFGDFQGVGSGVSYSRTAHEHVYLTSIQIPNEVQLSFTMQDREDIIKNFMFTDEFPVIPQNPKRYTSIQITGLQSESSFIKNIVLKQSYFNQEYLYNYSSPDYNGETNKFQMLRGRLDHVLINDQKYTFEYNQGETNLVRKSTYAVDHFGYYNGRDDNFLLWPLRQFNGGASASNNIGFAAGDLSDLNDNTSDLWDFFSDPKRQVYFQHITRKPNIEYAVIGSLRKVTYPTGGSSEYFYEALEYFAPGLTNSTIIPTFNGYPYYNNLGAEAYAYLSAIGLPEFTNSGTVQAGGLRIHKIENRDRKKNLKLKTTYSYENINGVTSGKLLTPLLFVQGSLSSTGNYTFWFRNPSYLSSSITAQGKRVGYSSVTEIQEDMQGNGFKTIYEFNNQPINTEAILNTRQYTNHSLENGRLHEATSYNSLEDPVKKEEEVVEDLELETINAVTYFVGHNDNLVGYSHQLLSKTPVIQPLTKQTTTTTFGFNSSDLTNAIETTSLNSFNADGQVISSETIDSENNTLKTVTKRLSDYTNSDCVTSEEGGCLKDTLLYRNRKDLVLEEIVYKNDEVIGAKGYRYDLEHGNVVLKEVYVHEKSNGDFTGSTNGFEFNGNYTSRLVFEDYDTEGNLLQQKLTNGRPVSYVWGHNNKYPIVKGENISHTDLLVAHNASQGVNYESAIRSHALTSEALITTYQYDPLVGIVKATDARGLETNYDYDLLNRLDKIKDEDLNILQDYDYNYGDIEKEGGLYIWGVNFGVATPSSNITKFMNIKNNGNYDITIFGVDLPQYFSSPWENTSFDLRPNETFRFPVKFHAPSTTTTINSSAIIRSNQLNGTNEYGNIQAQVITNGAPELTIVGSDCKTIDWDFGSAYFTIQNTGTAPLYIYNITSDDDCVLSSWEDKLLKWVVDENGTSIQVYDTQASAIQPGEQRTFSAHLQCPLNTNNNWDGVSELKINVYNINTSFEEPAYGNTYVRRYSTQCPTGPPPPPENTFTINGDTTADCSSGMSGTITVNSGSISVYNQWNVTSGPNFIGATITMSEVGTVDTSGVIVTPTTYPKTYTFSSGSCNCSNGFGTSQIVVTSN